MHEAVLYHDVVSQDLPGAVSFALPGGSLAAIITSRQDENDQLVRLMLGLSKPDTGCIALLGEDVGTVSQRALDDLRKRIAVVFPSGGLISNLKVWENLVLPLEYHQAYSQAEIEERGLAVLRRVGYSGGLMELPGHLSHYERRLIGLARAMLTEPELIVYNAVLGGLSGDEKKAIIAAALAFHREKPGRTSLFFTPSPETVKDITFDRVIVLKRELAA